MDNGNATRVNSKAPNIELTKCLVFMIHLLTATGAKGFNPGFWLFLISCLPGVRNTPLTLALGMGFRMNFSSSPVVYAVGKYAA